MLNKYKIKIVEELVKLNKIELIKAEEVYNSTNLLATEGDVKQESKYDTRGIEASYLAGAQKKRVEELKFDLHKLEDFMAFAFKPSDEVVLGSLVEIDMGKEIRLYFMTPAFGGIQLYLDHKPIFIISTVSPMGEAIIGLSEGDEFELDPTKRYSILKVN